MPSTSSTYYLGRVHKSGLSDNIITQALFNPKPVQVRKYKYTFISADQAQVDGVPYIFAQLAKYEDLGEVSQVLEYNNNKGDISIPQKIDTISNFVYLPTFSGIAYQHIWNRIDRKCFVQRFREIICKTHDDFFVNVSIADVSETKEFLKLVKSFKSIKQLKATVEPPNPLFGIFWKSLKDYLADRNLQQFQITEKSDNMKTRIVDALEQLSQAKEPGGNAKPLSLTDAAVLMSIDGYGQADITGDDGSRLRKISTRTTVQNFRFDSMPFPEELAQLAIAIFANISKNRHMEH